jgi:hypothetical protein
LGGDVAVTGNGGMCCIMFNLFFLYSVCFHCLLSSVNTELLYVLIIYGLATTCWVKLKLPLFVHNLTMKMKMCVVVHSSMH